MNKHGDIQHRLSAPKLSQSLPLLFSFRLEQVMWLYLANHESGYGRRFVFGCMTPRVFTLPIVNGLQWRFNISRKASINAFRLIRSRVLGILMGFHGESAID
jgi:hypothetical protein